MPIADPIFELGLYILRVIRPLSCLQGMIRGVIFTQGIEQLVQLITNHIGCHLHYKTVGPGGFDSHKAAEIPVLSKLSYMHSPIV